MTWFISAFKEWKSYSTFLDTYWSLLRSPIRQEIAKECFWRLGFMVAVRDVGKETVSRMEDSCCTWWSGVNFLDEVLPKKISKRFVKACLRSSVSKRDIRLRTEQAFTRLKDCTAYRDLSVALLTYPLSWSIYDVEQVIHEVQYLSSQEHRRGLLLQLLDGFDEVLVVVS